MTSLSQRNSLQALARILHAASITGGQAWDQPDRASNDGASKTESGLADDLASLFRLLADRGVSYLLVGGVAMLRYIDGRNTDDIDIILAVEDAARVPELVIESRNADAAKAHFRGVRVDLLFTSNAVFRLAKERFTTTHAFGGIPISCATIEGLVLLKLYALPSLYAQGDMQRAALYETDVLMLCQRHAPDVEPLMKSLQPHVAPSAYDELRRIVDEIRQRLARMRSQSH